MSKIIELHFDFYIKREYIVSLSNFVYKSFKILNML